MPTNPAPGMIFLPDLFAAYDIGIAKGCGITLTKEDFEFDEGELSDEDLENVSGGSKKGWKKFWSAFAGPDYPKSSEEDTKTTEDQN